jgi:hypothetical protein
MGLNRAVRYLESADVRLTKIEATMEPFAHLSVYVVVDPTLLARTVEEIVSA